MGFHIGRVEERAGARVGDGAGRVEIGLGVVVLLAGLVGTDGGVQGDVVEYEVPL
jgi:hypothetical protein